MQALPQSIHNLKEYIEGHASDAFCNKEEEVPFARVNAGYHLLGETRGVFCSAKRGLLFSGAGAPAEHS